MQGRRDRDEIKLRAILKELSHVRGVPPLDCLTLVTIRKPEPRHTLMRDQPKAAGARSSWKGALAAAPEAPTLIEAIEITCKTKADSDMVYNHLLDSCRAEFKLLFNDISTAERVTYASALPQVEGVFAAQYGQPGRRFFRNLSKGYVSSETLRGQHQKLTRDEASVNMRWAGVIARVADHDGIGVAILENGRYPKLDGIVEDGGHLAQIVPQIKADDKDATLTVYVTHQLKTVKIYEEGVDMEKTEHWGFLIFKYGHLPRRYGQAELSPMVGEPGLTVDVQVNTSDVYRPGDVRITFLQEVQEDDLHDMTTEQLLGYLEDMVPWP